jgi:hypothetical protein
MQPGTHSVVPHSRIRSFTHFGHEIVHYYQQPNFQNKTTLIHRTQSSYIDFDNSIAETVQTIAQISAFVERACSERSQDYSSRSAGWKVFIYIRHLHTPALWPGKVGVLRIVREKAHSFDRHFAPDIGFVIIIPFTVLPRLRLKATVAASHEIIEAAQ